MISESLHNAINALHQAIAEQKDTAGKKSLTQALKLCMDVQHDDVTQHEQFDHQMRIMSR